MNKHIPGKYFMNSFIIIIYRIMFTDIFLHILCVSTYLLIFLQHWKVMGNRQHFVNIIIQKVDGVGSSPFAVIWSISLPRVFKWALDLFYQRLSNIVKIVNQNQTPQTWMLVRFKLLILWYDIIINIKCKIASNVYVQFVRYPIINDNFLHNKVDLELYVCHEYWNGYKFRVLWTVFNFFLLIP